MRQNLFDSGLWDSIFQRGLKLRSVTETLSADKTIDKDEGVSFFLKEAAEGLTTTRTVNLPDPSDVENENVVFFLHHLGGDNTTPPTLVVQQTTTTSADTVATLEEGETAFLFNNGATWAGLVGSNT